MDWGSNRMHTPPGSKTQRIHRSHGDVKRHAPSVETLDGEQCVQEERSLKESVLHHLHYTLARPRLEATEHDYYVALVHAIRERLIARWIRTQQRYLAENRKRVYYLSMEYLTGRTLSNALINLGLFETCTRELAELGIELDQLLAAEWEAGLGNGGLGRLAACLLDSMATLGLPACGYGIRYEFGIFHQKIENGYQVEMPDNWLRLGNPWEVARPEDTFQVQFYGTVRQIIDSSGRQQFQWVPGEDALAMAYDMPIPGYQSDTVNTLRLWAATSSHGFNLVDFNRGDYVAAVEELSRSRNISRVLYPNDNCFLGKELRLKQEYFLVSASLQDILRRYKRTHADLREFSDKIAIQLNDTHPTLAIPELMRILIDVEQLSWEDAWSTCVATFAYTNHTLLPEALEQWSVELLERVLPRHLQIIYEINSRFLQEVKHLHPGDIDRLRRMSLVVEGDNRSVRMSHLAVVGSHAVNGVSQLHSELLRRQVFRDFDEFFPERFCATTNGITPRRWLKLANPRLADLITEYIGDGWIRDLSQLESLANYAHNEELANKWQTVKRNNKLRLAKRIHDEQGIDISIDSLFDCHVKRVHEYKRQMLTLLHVIVMYNAIRAGNRDAHPPRTVLIAGKAAPGYDIARLMIKLINDVAEVVNHDPATRDFLKVVFLPNYNVSLAEVIFPATELSEQISTAGTEASGTGNMKAMLNGALTIGTLDGANIEILESVGDEHIFIFGMTAEEVERTRAQGQDPRAICRSIPALQDAVDMIASGFFSSGNPRTYQPLLDSIFEQGDRYMVFADFADYLACQQRVAATWRDPKQWTSKSIINVARAGRFSSDRTVLRYASQIWGLSVDGHPTVPQNPLS